MLTPTETAQMRSDWAALKAATGAPISPDRMARLSPHHLSDPRAVSSEMAQVHQITERVGRKVRAMIATGSGGDAA